MVWILRGTRRGQYSCDSQRQPLMNHGWVLKAGSYLHTITCACGSRSHCAHTTHWALHTDTDTLHPMHQNGLGAYQL